MIGNVVRIAKKDLRLLWADKVGMFWVLAFPLIMALFFGVIFGGGGGGGASALRIAVVDLDRSDASRAFVERLVESDALRVWPEESDDAEDRERARTITEDAARDMVRRGAIVAYLAIPEGYAGSGPFGSLGAELRVGIDPSRSAEAGYLQGLLMQATFESLQSALTDQGAMAAQMESMLGDVDEWDLDPAQKLVFKGLFGSVKTFMDSVDPEVYAQGPLGAGGADEDGNETADPEAGDDGEGGDGEGGDGEGEAGGFNPVNLEIEEIVREGSGPRSAFEVSFPQSMMWAVLGACASFAVTLVRERKEGTLLRLRVAPHPMGAIIAGKGLACFLTCVGALALLTTIAHLIFGMRIESYGLYVLGVVCTGICFVGIMMAITTLGTTEEAVAGAGWGVLLICAMLGGGMVPLMAMPDWLGALAKFSPVRWAVYSLEGAVWRGLTLGELVPAYAILVGVGGVAFAFGVWVFRRREG